MKPFIGRRALALGVLAYGRRFRRGSGRQALRGRDPQPRVAERSVRRGAGGDRAGIRGADRRQGQCRHPELSRATDQDHRGLCRPYQGLRPRDRRHRLVRPVRGGRLYRRSHRLDQARCGGDQGRRHLSLAHVLARRLQGQAGRIPVRRLRQCARLPQGSLRSRWPQAACDDGGLRRRRDQADRQEQEGLRFRRQRPEGPGGGAGLDAIQSPVRRLDPRQGRQADTELARQHRERRRLQETVR